MGWVANSVPRSLSICQAVMRMNGDGSTAATATAGRSASTAAAQALRTASESLDTRRSAMLPPRGEVRRAIPNDWVSVEIIPEIAFPIGALSPSREMDSSAPEAVPV